MAQDDQEDKGASFGSRFLSTLKDMIIEEDAPPKKAPQEPAAQEAAAASSTPSAPAARAAQPSPAAPAARAPAPQPAATNSPMYANLMSLTLARQTAYTALTEAMTPLEEIIPDEMTRYRAAFAVIKKNRTLDQVVQAIELQHLEALDQEVARFAVQAKSKEYTDVQAKQEEAGKLKANIDAANAQIVQLRQQFEERVRAIEDSVQRDRQRTEEIEREITDNRAAIDSVQRQFDSTAQAVRQHLESAKAKILQYLA